MTVSFSHASDPSSADVAAGFHFSFDTTQAALATSYAATGTSTSSFTFIDNGSHTVYGRIFDKDDGYTDHTTAVTVKNVPPTATFTAPASVDEGARSCCHLPTSRPVCDRAAAGFTYAFALGPLRAVRSSDTASFTPAGSAFARSRVRSA